MRTIARRSGALVILAAFAVATTAPAVADGGRPSGVTQRQSILTELSPTGQVGTSRIFTQLTVSGSGPVSVTLPEQSTRGLRSLDGFRGPDVSGDEVTWNLDATPGGTTVRTVARSTADLPVTVAVTYHLDGQEVAPRVVVGRTGRLEVTYTVSNLTGEPRDLVAFDARNQRTIDTVDVAVPMVGSLALTLPPAFTDIDAPGANVVGDGRGSTVVNFSLLLFRPLGSEAQTVTYSAYVTDAVVPPATVQVVPVDATSFGSLRSTEDAYRGAIASTLQLANGALILDSNVQLLAAGAAQLLDGLEQLAEGAEQLSEGLAGSAAPGARELADGTGRARSGAGELSSGLGELSLGANRLSDGLGDARSGGRQLSSGLVDLADGSARLDDGAGALSAGATQLDTGARQLVGGATQVESGAAGLLSGLQLLKASLTSADGLPKAIAGVGQLSGAVDALLTAIGSPTTPNTLLNGLARVAGGLSNPACVLANPSDPANPCGVHQVLGLLVGGADQLEAGLVQLRGGLSNPLCDGTPENPCGVRQGLGQLDAGVAGVDAAVSSVISMLASIDPSLLSAGDQTALATAIGTLGPAGVQGGLAQLDAGIEQIDAGVGLLLAGIGDAATAATLRNGVAQLKGGLAGVQAGVGTPSDVGTLSNGVARITAGVSNPDCVLTDPSDPANPCGIRQALQLIAGGLGELDAGLSGALAGIDAGLGSPTDGATSLIGGAALLSGGTSRLAAGAAQLQRDGTSALAAGADQLADGAGQLAAGAGRASDGAEALHGGLVQLDDGGQQLAAGAGRAATGGRDLASGLGLIDDGANRLADGLGDAADGSTRLAEGLSSAEEGGGKIAAGTVRLSEVGMASLIDGVSGAVLGTSLSRAEIAAVSARGRDYSAPYGVAAGADASAVWKFEIAGVGTETGPSTGLLAGLAVLALGAAGAASVALRRRLA